MGLKRLMLLSCAATGTFIGLNQVALAQESGGGIGEVVVTAEKREQSIQDVPVAVTAFTAETRQILGINTMEDYARVAPGVVYTNNDRLSIRGIGRMTNAIGTDPAAAAYNDGIFSNSMQFATDSPMYLSRVEVLRGPQGTLYGRNSIAGLLNVVSRRPAGEWEGEIRSTIGNYDTRYAEALVSGPLGDNFRILVGGSLYQRGEGYIENLGPSEDTGDQARTYMEGQIEWEVTPDIRANFRIQASHWGDNYGVGNVLTTVLAPYNTGAAAALCAGAGVFSGNCPIYGAPGGAQNLYYNAHFNGTGNGIVNGITNPSLNDPYTINTNQPAIGRLFDNITTSFNLTWDVGGANIRYLAGWAGYNYFTTGVDADQTARTGNYVAANGATNVSPNLGGFYYEAQEWFSNEINISSDGDGPVRWIAGLYQYHQDYSQEIGLRVYGDPYMVAPVGYLRAPACVAGTTTECNTGLGTYAMFGPAVGSGAGAAPNRNGDLSRSAGTLLVDSYAAFGQVDWEFAPTLTATLGLRYTTDEKEGYDYTRVVGRNGSTGFSSNTSAGLISAGTYFGILGAPNFNQAADFTIAAVCGGTLTLGQGACTPASGIFEVASGGLARNLSYSSEATTGTFNLQWEPSNDLNFYARYSRGYKSGGWFGISTLAPNPYARPEYIDAIELGAKVILAEQLQANLAVYQYDYQDMQIPIQSFAGTVTQTRLENLDSEVRGAEIELVWSPSSWLQMFANYAYTDAEITRGCCFVDPADPGATARGARPFGPAIGTSQPQTLVGNQNVNAPENKYALGAILTFDTQAGTFIASTTYMYTDEQQYRPFANAIYESPASELTNFRLIYIEPQERFRLTGYVNNAFDEVAYGFSEAYSNPTLGHPVRRTVSLNTPREFGVELQFHF